MLFTDLIKHKKLANERHPMFERNRFGKFIFYFGVIFWAGYLIFFGVTFPPMFNEIFPNMEPYHIMNKGLIYLLIFDFLSRFALQKTPTQEMKPYLLMPVKKKKLLHIYLLQSALAPYNLYWLVMIIPFSFLTLFKFYGLTGVILYCLGIWLLMILNNFWYLFCRTLINEKIIFILIPLFFYGLLGTAEFTFDYPVSTFTMNLGEGFFEGNVFSFLGVILAILLMGGIDRKVQMHYMYCELSKVKDTKVKHVSEYKYLERYGDVGEFIRLELKLLFRNKLCKRQFSMGCFFILLFSGSLLIDAYDGVIGKSFVLTYNYSVLGIMMLTQLMSFEGNYIDGLMSRKESIYNLLMAKYYFYSTLTLIPFILSIPAIVMGKTTLLSTVAYMALVVGPVYCMLFQLAVYNKKTIALNENVMGKNSSGSFFQSLISITSLGMPIILNMVFTFFFSEETAQWIFLASGIIAILTSRLWIANVYKRFMKRRYVNMEGFRDSK